MMGRKIHSAEELQRMFDEFGLGREEERRRVQQLAGEHESSDESRDGYELLLDNSSTDFFARIEDAKLARDPE